MADKLNLEALHDVIAGAVEDGLARHAVAACLDYATSEANLRASLAPLVLAQHERIILATLLAGEVRDLAVLDPLSAAHFGGRERGQAYMVLRRQTEARGPEWLFATLRGSFRTPAATVERLVEEIWAAPVAPASSVLSALVAEVIAAHELSEFARATRSLMARARLRAADLDPRAMTGALDAAGLRRELREAAACLTPALAAVEKAGA